jgi:xanthine dehydrogenase accessory factor
MHNPTAPSRPVVIVLGCGDVGSAVALELQIAGFAVVLIDEADPAWHLRGMAFTNAWYMGNAELDGEGACFCASMRSIPSVLAKRMIAATTWSWPGVAGLLAPAGLIDARGRKRRGSDILRGRVPLTIGIGRDFVGGDGVDVAIELPDTPHRADRAVAADRHGRFMTERRIGDAVRVGQIVGGLGNEVIAAPASGVLRGLAARGARIEPGDTLVEIDPRGIPFRCHGVGEDSRRVAAIVVSALATFVALPIQIEREMVSSGCNTRTRQ